MKDSYGTEKNCGTCVRDRNRCHAIFDCKKPNYKWWVVRPSIKTELAKRIKQSYQTNDIGNDMSVKHFCDLCGVEITDANKANLHSDNFRMKASVNENGVTLTTEIMTSKDGTTNAGDFCKYCIIDCINTLDDRPVIGTSDVK